jgi:hypothetical protein
MKTPPGIQISRVDLENRSDAELVEAARDQQLVLQGEVDAFALTAVAEGGVVNTDTCHETA